MYLIVGLGNPGKKYEGTRHNLGFRVVDLLRERFGLEPYDSRFESEMAKGAPRGVQLLLLKPQTFMNLSGGAVTAAARYHKVPPDRLWVVHDDLDLPLGHLRIRVGGSSGGHRGVQSIIDRLGTQDFVRFRLGIGRPQGPMPADAYVVAPFGREEREAAEAMIARAAEAVTTALSDGLTKAMNLFNR
jgi:PTH1 family peptidyl-tRNA hydrolase